MGLKKVASSKAVDLNKVVHPAVDSPSVLLYRPAHMQLKYLALRLLGITSFTSDGQLAAVHEAAATISDSDDVDWTVADAMQILNAVGAFPAPTHLKVWPLEGEGIVLCRAVQPGTTAAAALNYSKGRPRISILAAAAPEGIRVPKGMALDVPVKLVDDQGALALALYLRRGKLREITEVKEEKPPGENV